MRSIALLIAVSFLLLFLGRSNLSIAAKSQQRICDVDADYSLGVEDYLEAIRRHVAIVRTHPGNALTHYHLGFALGMVELVSYDYQRRTNNES